MWNAWGIAWGDSWGSSWGPLYEVEENPGQVYGSGKRLHGPADDALIAQVLDKWETIEAARALDEARKAKAKPIPASVPLSPKAGEDTQSGGIAPLYTDSTNSPFEPVDIAVAATELIAVDALRAQSMRRANEAAIMVAMLELM